MRTLLFLLLIYSTQAVSQTSPGEEMVYFNEEFTFCAKEEAFYIGLKFDKEEKTDLIVYYPNRQQALTGSFLDKKLRKKEGVFTWFDTNGVRVAVTEFKNNIQDGMYLFWYENKSLKDSGSYKYGYPDGLWKGWYADGQLSMLCVYNAKAISDYNKTSANNFRSIENIQSEKPPMTLYRSRPSYSQSYLPRTRRNPFYFPAEVVPQSTIYSISSDGANSTNTRNNTRNNNQISKIPEIQLPVLLRYDLIIPAEIIYDGDYYTYYPNGQAKEQGSYKEGSKKGFWETWYENGKRKTVGKYERNHEVQEWKYYNSDGELLMVRQYKKNGRLSNEIKMK